MPVLLAPIGRVLFLHVPKTAGTYVRHCWPKHCWEREAGPIHRFREAYSGEFEFSFCFGRDSVAWHESYFHFRHASGWESIEDYADPWVLDDCRADTFEGFMRNVTERKPTAYPDLLARYSSGVDFVGRVESLADDLAEIGRRIGIAPEFPPRRLRARGL